MEGNVIERRTSSAQLWSDARQMTVPSTSTTSPVATTPVGVPTYSNIFVTPPTEAEKAKETETPSKLSQIKDKHDGETQLRVGFCFKLIFQIYFPFHIERGRHSQNDNLLA